MKLNSKETGKRKRKIVFAKQQRVVSHALEEAAASQRFGRTLRFLPELGRTEVLLLDHLATTDALGNCHLVGASYDANDLTTEDLEDLWRNKKAVEK